MRPSLEGGRRLLSWILGGVVLGALMGGISPASGQKVGFLGEIFLNFLMMLVAPLVMTSMIVGVTNLGDFRKLGRIGWQTLAYYIATTGISVVIGIALVNVIRPGAGLIPTEARRSVQRGEFSFVQVVVGFVPKNIFEAMVEMKVLPLIVFSLLFGGALSAAGERGRTAVDFFRAVNEALMKLVHLIMYFAPLGVFGLVAARLGKAGGWEEFGPELSRVLSYSLTVLLGLTAHGALVLPLILWTLGGRRVVTYASRMSPALLTAFSTASSSATLPVTIECVVRRNEVSEEVAGFVLPLGATINMDGTALYEAVAAIFIAQAYNIPLSPVQQMVVFLTATLASIGAAGIPQAGLVTMVMVLKAVDLPLEGIAMILTVDWLLDRFRTTVNVWGDSVGSAVLERVRSRT